MKKNRWIARIIFFVIFFVIAVGYRFYDLGHYLTLESLKANQLALQGYYLEYPFTVLGFFFLFYVISTALSLPGAAILTLAAGAIFGLIAGSIIVSFASTMGATLAFLASRFLFRDLVQSKFREKIASINQGIEREGAFYLFTLRLVPVFPFFLVNLLMGLTSIRIPIYFFVSQLGMLPGTLLFVNAGTELAKISSMKEIFSANILFSLALIGVLPLISKFCLNWIRSRKFLRKYRSPRSFDYNMIVIGGGSAGLVSAYIASAVKAKVALVEKHKMGGDCLNTGCVPSKALIRSAKVLNYFKRAEEFGFDALPAKVDFAKVMERVQRVVKEIEPHDSIERYTNLGVECFQGNAWIRSPYEVEVNGRVLTTKNIVVATGASPVVPPIPGLQEAGFLTSDNVWNLRKLPAKLVVLGGGPIGCELAQSFARLGSSVVLVEMDSRIMAREDEDVSSFVAEKFHQESITVLTGHKALRVEAVQKNLVCEVAGAEMRVAFDEILVALGRSANVKGFGLEQLSVEVSSRGTIVANEYLQTTNYPNIYVCGDVTGPYQFTHTASHQAWYVAVNALFSPFKKFKVDYRVIPWCTFTDPEVARVGLNEQEAKEKKLEYQVSRYSINDLDRAIAESEAHGFVKVLTVPGKDKILGVTIVGDRAGDIVSEYVAAMKHGIGMNKILSTIHIYPTFSEANKYVAGVWKKQNAPKKILKLLENFHSWRRGDNR